MVFVLINTNTDIYVYEKWVSAWTAFTQLAESFGATETTLAELRMAFLRHQECVWATSDSDIRLEVKMLITD